MGILIFFQDHGDRTTISSQPNVILMLISNTARVIGLLSRLILNSYIKKMCFEFYKKE